MGTPVPGIQTREERQRMREEQQRASEHPQPYTPESGDAQTDEDLRNKNEKDRKDRTDVRNEDSLS